jgi:predicted dehydrogenase
MTRAASSTRLAIAGLGSIGHRHARIAASHGWEVAIFDPAPTGVEAYTITNSFDELLAWSPDALVVAGPDSVHAEQALGALRHGITTLIEKPLARTVDEAQAIATCEAETGVRALVGYVLRYNRVLEAAADAIRAGVLGSLVSFHLELGAYETLQHARSRFVGGPPGAIYGDYSHEWHYTDWLFGPIARGLAVERLVPGLPLEQTPNVVDGLLELTDGSVGTFHLDYVQVPSRRSLTAIGTAGSLTVNVPTGVLTLRPREGVARVTTFEQKTDDPYLAQLVHLIAIARDQAEPRVPVNDGLRALAVATALRESARQQEWTQVADTNGLLESSI